MPYGRQASAPHKSDDRQAADPHEWLARRPCTFDRWETADLTPSRFEAEGFATRPLLLPLPTDGPGAWPAVGRWSAEYLTRVAGGGTVRPLRAPRNRTAGGLFRYLAKFTRSATLSEYLDHLAAVAATRRQPDAELDGAGNNAEYMFMQTDFSSDGLGRLKEDIAAPVFLLETLNETDLYLMLGGKGTGLGFHDHGSAWLAMLSGRKFWMVFPPKVFERMEAEIRQFDLPRLRGDYRSPRYDDPGRDRVTARRLRRMLLSSFPDDDTPAGFTTKGFECVQDPGTIVYVPPGWWHAVVNLDDGTIAVGGQPSGSELHTETRSKAAATSTELRRARRYKAFRSAADAAAAGEAAEL